MVAAVISVAFGAVWVPAAKIFRTLQGVRRLLDGQMNVSEHRSFVSFVASLADMREKGLYNMQGLWSPIQEGGEISRGPTTIVDTHSTERRRFRKRW